MQKFNFDFVTSSALIIVFVLLMTLLSTTLSQPFSPNSPASPFPAASLGPFGLGASPAGPVSASAPVGAVGPIGPLSPSADATLSQAASLARDSLGLNQPVGGFGVAGPQLQAASIQGVAPSLLNSGLVGAAAAAPQAFAVPQAVGGITPLTNAPGQAVQGLFNPQFPLRP